MESSAEGNLLEIMSLARTLRQEQLFIQQEQTAFALLSKTLAENSTSITKLAYICAQQRHNLNDLIVARPETGPNVCCQRARNYENAKFVDSKAVMEYEHAIAYEDLFSYLYGAPYLLALSLATGDRLPDVSAPHLNSVINTISMGLYGNAINTKDVEMTLKLLRELIEIQLLGSEQPRRLLRTNSSAFARLYRRLHESMFSAKIFLTAALFEPLMCVLSESADVVLDVDPQKVVDSLSSKERLRRFGAEATDEYAENVLKFHAKTLAKLHKLAKCFIDSFAHNWSVFPSTLRWLVQTMCHQLKQTHYAEKVINDIIADMVFTHFICPAIISPDVMGIIDAPITEQVRFNLMQIAQIIQMLAMTRHVSDVESKYATMYAQFEANLVTHLIDLLLLGQTGEDVVAILSQQSDFDRSHLVSTERELRYFVEFFRILNAHDEYDISAEERKKLKKILAHIPENDLAQTNGTPTTEATGHSKEKGEKERTKPNLINNLGKVTKSKLAKSMSFSISNGEPTVSTATGNGSGSTVPLTTQMPTSNGGFTMINGNLQQLKQQQQPQQQSQLTHHQHHHHQQQQQRQQQQQQQSESNQQHDQLLATSNGNINLTNSSPIHSLSRADPTSFSMVHGGVVANELSFPPPLENEPILIFNIYGIEKNKLQPLTEEEVLKMNSIGPEISSTADGLLVDTAESCNHEHTIDKSSEANGYDGIDGMSDVLQPHGHHVKATRFSLSQDDASIGNSDNLEAVSEAPSNHSVTSSLELEEENDQNDNLSDMVSANVSGRGTPNISGRDTPSSQVTDGGGPVHNALPTPQMQKLLSKVRSDIEDKFCKFEIKKFEGDENVSIISDTWSTDVLASDSETLDASERERDRNFSTPLIPSAVVLPGDNNFVDALANASGSVRGYLDASDQRSESNWSTDVLASDSEKLAEVDTDDNVSITAKSDITDAGARSETERDMLAAAISARGVRNFRSGTLTTRNGAGSGGSRDSGAGIAVNVDADPDAGHAGVAGNAVPREQAENMPGSSGDNVSDRSQEDSAFFDAVNIYDDAAGVSRNYQGPSSLARSSVRTTNQFSGENSFQQNYKCSYNDDSDKASFLGTPRMRRQTSAESSISNQSLNKDDGGKPPKPHHKTALKKKKQHYNTTGSHNMKALGQASNKDCQDLIDFSDGSELAEKALTIRTAAAGGGCSNENGIDVFVNPQQRLVDFFGISGSGGDGLDAVEHRRISVEQRNAGDDGRRNGIMALKSDVQHGNETSGSRVTPSMRRHQSLNYENHEIMLDVNIPKRVSTLPTSNAIYTAAAGQQSALSMTKATTTIITKTAQTDDDKQQELLSLCAKTEQLQLNEEPHYVANISTVHKLAGTVTPLAASQSNANVNASVSASANVNANVNANVSSSCVGHQQQKPTKSTGAIPKSISFDASADKLSSSGVSGGVGPGQSGIFNKLKQGIFKHRRSNKAYRHGGGNPSSSLAAEQFTPSGSNNRSVSFNPNSAEVTLDLMISVSGGVSTGGRNAAAVFCDISEEILAKYRRKVSTSSEATNSDSTGNGAGLLLSKKRHNSNGNNNNTSNINNNTANTEVKLPHVFVHDKTLAFGIIKKKIRTVLSKTDLHSGDFRQTTHMNASPLQTYLQIQLAQAINLHNFQQISYVSEAIRCIATLEYKQHAQLLNELQHDIQKRQNYLQYLMRYQQNLLLVMENLEQFERRLCRESTTCNRYLMHVCIRRYLEKCQAKIEKFQMEFSRLTLSDDKIELIEEFVENLTEELQHGLLHGAPDWQTEEARNAIERILLQRMYQQVMFPNDDADLLRDTVLSEHISKLQRIICPSHPALCIPQEYLAEAPWIFAQQQLSYISAYKTPREKLDCVIRCISSIMSLLQMSSGRVPAADDVLPVLIYVVIMANPPYLLSTIEYITCFIGEKLNGEAQFHWTLFGSVVKFIKTMDYFD